MIQKIGLDLKEDINRLYDVLHEKHKTVSSGIYELDKIIDGGFHEKTLTLFIMGTNGGKSATKCGLATNALLQNKKVLYVSMEMSEEEVTKRIVANLIDVDINNLKLLTREELQSKIFKKSTMV